MVTDASAEGLKFTNREVLPWSLCAVLRDWIGDGIGCAGWYREGQCWVRYKELSSVSVIVEQYGQQTSAHGESRDSLTAGGLTYTVLASPRRIAWRARRSSYRSPANANG